MIDDMSYATAPTNEVIIFGSGMETGPDGSVILNQAGLERVDRFLEYFYDNTKAFASSEAFVVCSGGYALLAHGVKRPADAKAREGILAADYLVRGGVPQNMIRVESDSTSTLENLHFSIRDGLLDPARYTAEYRLGGVSHGQHLKRAMMTGATVGIQKGAFEPIYAEGQEDTRREFMLRCAYYGLMLGVHDAKTALRRERLPAAVMAAVRGTGGGRHRKR